MPQADTGRDRLELRIEPDLLERVKRQARRKGLGLSAYVRLVLSERAEADEATEPRPGDQAAADQR